LKVARIIKDPDESHLSNLSTVTYALLDETGNAITAEEISAQTRMQIPADLEDFIFGGYAGWAKTIFADLSLNHSISQFKLLPPIIRTFKIICLAFNYSDQTSWVRFGRHPPKDPVIYFKSRTSLTGPYDDVICPSLVHQLDYEGELAFAISRKCRNVDLNNAIEYVGGYFAMNDVSARDIQYIDKQYSRAKSFDTFGPCGPWLTTPDEIPDPNNLRLITRVNGEIRQNSSTSNLILKVQMIIHSLSKIMTLEPGDIISTGTPSGTILSLSTKLKYLKDGDTIEVEIEKLGKIRNRIRFVD
jgi:2-keto-4-pentenoate hydratase/2-oxohepta-3-ene-1,7-dioic acid hydratase in catechol pathway